MLCCCCWCALPENWTSMKGNSMPQHMARCHMALMVRMVTLVTVATQHHRRVCWKALTQASILRKSKNINKCRQYLTELATAVLLTLFLKVPPCYTRQRRQCTQCHYMAITWSLVATLCASVSYWPTVTLCTRHNQGSRVVCSHSFSLRFSMYQELGASLWSVIDRKKLCAVRTVCPISGLVVTPNARKMMTE